MSQQKRRVVVYRHGDTYFIGAMSFFERSPGAALSTLFVLVDGRTATDDDLGNAVHEMLRRSGVLDGSQVARGEPGRTFESQSLGLPSDAVLESETVTVTVSLQGGVLKVRPMQTLGPGGGFGGSRIPAQQLDPDSSASTVGAAVREATETAMEISAAVLEPAGSWRGEQVHGVEIPSGGVVTVRRRTDQGWSVTARMGARGGESASVSTSVEQVAPKASFGDLGRAVVELLGSATAGNLQPGDEDPAGGERQVLVEADEFGLTLYPQAINPDTGEWDVPAHQDVRTLPRQASLKEVGQAVTLAADEAPEG